ncbi:MAG: hypothetical protein LC776_16280 [Acidobacteria bacterium]|nr:hypothetical protein [Acidobacteriota bacterium]
MEDLRHLGSRQNEGIDSKQFSIKHPPRIESRAREHSPARIPAFAPLWKDYLTRPRATDPDLFEGHKASMIAG